MQKTIVASLLWMLFLFGCASQQFTAVPSDLDRQNVTKKTIDVSAERYIFTPEIIRVQQGTLVTLRIRAIDATHGFQLGAFGIDERLDENETKVVEFYASKKGEYNFHCSHVCGIGHLGMSGKVVVE